MLEASNPSAPNKVFLAGLVPDGVASVTANLVDGSTETLPVSENVYMQEVSDELQSVTVRPSQVLVAPMPAK